MPTLIRISEFPKESGEFRTKVYLQPAFTSTGRNQKVETLNDMTLGVKPVGSHRLASFAARSFGEFVEEPEGDLTSGFPPMTYRYDTDPGALTVAPNEGRVLIVSFGRKVNSMSPIFEEGKRYELSFTVKRNSRWTGPPAALFRQPPPSIKGCITVRAPREEEVERMRNSEEGGLVPLSVESAECSTVSAVLSAP